MELDINLGKVFCCKTPEEKKAVIPVECSMILPDYFPDVMKILRYTAKTVKSPVFSEGGCETVSGNVYLEVSYISEEGELCSCSQLQPFSHSFDCGGRVAAAETEVSVGEIGCRAVNKRRIDLHGSIEIVLRTVCGEEKSFVADAKGAGAVCKKENAETVALVGEFYKTVTIDEKCEIGYGKPPFGKAVRTSAVAEVTECHVIQDKIVTKGEAKINVFWKPETADGETEEEFCSSSFDFPISRMVDAEGILMTDICDARYEAGFAEISSADDGQSVNVKLKVNIFARVYRKEPVEYLSDMFSSEYETKAEKGKFCFITKAVPVSLTENIFEKFELPETAKTVLDIWTEVSAPRILPEGKILFDAKFCMFAKDAEEMPVYFEKTETKETECPEDGNGIVFHNISAAVKTEEFNTGRDGKTEISASVLMDGTVYYGLSTEMITACSVNAEKKIEKDPAAVMICYAEKGEQIWDIAKKYRAPVADIMTENGISSETLLEKTMLIIPK